MRVLSTGGTGTTLTNSVIDIYVLCVDKKRKAKATAQPVRAGDVLAHPSVSKIEITDITATLIIACNRANRSRNSGAEQDRPRDEMS